MKRINHKALLFYVVFSTGVTLQCVAQFGGGPVTTPTINPISGQGPYCTNENSIFTVTLPQGCTFINWRFVGGTIEYFNGSSASTQSITARFSANGTLYAQCSCGETSKPITVVSPPSVSASANPETVTAGSQVTLTASGTAATYSWTGNGLVQTTGATVTAIPPEGENYYTATGTSATEGCYNQSTVKVTATAAPLDAGPDRTYCRDAGPVDLTSWGLNLSAGSWSGPTGSISNGFVILANLSTGTHTFTYTRTADGKSDGILLTVIQTEEGHISPNITSNCEVASGSLTLQAYDGTIQFWEKSTDDGINWLKVSSATGGFETAPTINFSVSAETWFRASVKKDVCAVSFTDHVEVVPKNPFGGSISFTEIYQTCGQAKGIIRHDNGRGDTFTWEENTGSGWVPITGATNPYSFDVSSSRTFRVRAETSGCATKYTNELSVYTNSVAGRVRTSSGSTAVCGSFNGNLLLVGTNIGTVTKWQYSTDNSNWSDIASSSGKTVLSYTASEPVNYFRVFVTLDDCAPAVTPAFRLNVDPPTKPGAVTMALEKYPSETINGVLTFYPQFQLSGYRGTIQNWWQETETERTEIDVQTNVLDAVVTETTGFSAQVKNGVCDPLVSGRAIFFVNKAFLGVQQLVLGSSLSAYEGYSYIIKTGDGLELRDGFSFQANSGQQFFVLLDGNYSTPPSDHNYVMQEAVTVDGIKNDGDIYFLNASQKTSSISYFDGLGKLIQQVERRMSPTEKDVVTPMTYDDFGRNVVSFLSFTDEETSGYFKEDAVTKQRDFYLNPPPKIAATDYPFSVSVLEKSPVNRLLEQGSPGTEWQPDLGHTVKYEYQANDGESVKLWRVNENGMPVFVDEAGVSQFYKEGTLIVNVTQDEDGGRIRQYMDEFGRVVLKQVQLDDEWLETYYVYDKFGLLRYVIQPEGSARLTGNPDADFLHKWTFQYEYDQKGRAVVKKVAGGAPLFLVYDNRDRVVLLQDGNQRERNEWTFNKYDAFNRVVISGIYKHDGTGIISREDISALISADSFAETFTNELPYGYTTTNTFPRENLTVLTVSFYDNYQFLSIFSGSGDYSFAKAFPGEMNDAFPRVVGQTTGTMVRILETDEFLKSVSYYNNRHQMIQSISDNHLGGKDRVSQDFDFTRRLKARVVVHATANSEHRILEEFEYDHSGRILAQYHTIDDNGRVQLLSNGYNELGQLVERNLHLSDQGFVQSVDLRYNIRGWLTHINNASLTNDGGLTNDEANDLFGMEFKYNNPAGEASPQYTGNISEVQWRNLGTSRQRYEYQYDMAHRLVRADYLDLDNPTRAGRYSEMITGFDRNGNIQKLERKGLIDEPGPLVIAPFGPMDELQYAYEGNRLLSVTDLETGTTPKEKGFKDGNKSGSDYSYDANGNFTSDKNKDIVSITYNHLNLPVTVEKSTGETITYVYTATGTKLAQSLSSPAKVTQYDGAFIYENGQLQFVQHGEGRILMRDEPEYQYHIKDQVGNVRLTFTSEKIREVPKATMEPDNIAEATANFLYYDEAVKLNSDLFDHTKNGSTHYATRLSGAINETTGLARSVSVMPGDTIRAEVFVKYVDPNTDNWTGDLPALMASLADNSAPPGTLVDHGLPGSTGGMSVPFALLLSKPEQSTAAPKAFLNFLVFDSDFNLIEEQSGFIQVSEDAKENGENRSHERLFKEIIVEKSGYVYIFLSNDNLELQGATADVFFDDFSVEHMNSPIVQADDYYPFGLTFNNYQRENAVTNNFLYNGKERQNDLDLGWFDFGARMYMPEIARFGVLDPLGDMTYTQGPYNYVLNNPIYYADYKGKIPVPVLYFVYEGLVYAFTATAAMYIVVNHEKLTDGIYFGSTDSYLEARSKTKIPYYAPYVWKNWKPRAVIVDEHPNMEPKPDPNSKDNKPGSSFQKGAIAFLLLELLRECQTAGGQDMVEVVKEIDDANERINTRINEIYDLLEDIDPEKDRDEYLKLLDEKEALQNVRTEHNQLKSLIEMAEELAKSLEEDKKVKQDATRRSDQNYSKEFLEWWYKDTNKDKDDEDEDDD